MKLHELNIKHSSFQVVTQFLLKIQVFWDVTSHCSVSRFQHFEGTQRPHLQAQAVKKESVILLGPLDPEYKGTMILLNAGNYSLNNTSHIPEKLIFI